MLNTISSAQQLHSRFKTLIALALLTAGTQLLCQVRPPVSGGMSSISIGSSFAAYNADLGHNRLQGVTVWSDWQPSFVPAVLHGLGLELEARDLNENTSTGLPAVYRMTTFGGGAVYKVERYRTFHPYVKLLASYGSINWSNPSIEYRHETRSVYSPGGGFDAHVYRRFWVRADYEYQFWPNIAGRPDTIDPQGVSVGVSYQLSRMFATQ